MTRSAQRAFSGGIMSPGMYARRDISKWQTGLKDAVNVTLRAEGGVSNRAAFTFAGGFNFHDSGVPAFMIPFEASEDDTYVLIFLEERMYVMKSGALVLSTTKYDVVASTQTNPMTIELGSGNASASEDKLLYVVDPALIGDKHPLHGTIIRNDGATGNSFDVDAADGYPLSNTSGDFDMDTTIDLYEVYEIASPFALSEMPDVQFVQDVDTMVFAHPNHDPQKLVRVADDDWTFSDIDIEPTAVAPTILSTTAHVGSGSTTYNYQVTTVLQETGEESLPTADGAATVTNDLTTAGNQNRITWSPANTLWSHRVYKEFNGIYGFIGITDGTSFIDENITPDTSQNPPTGRNPFGSDTDDRPHVASFIDGRLCMGASNNNPQALELSSSIEPFNFNRALTPGASDAISFRMKSQKLNRVMHVVDANRPLILTAGAEWYIDTGDDAGIAPGNFALRPKTYRGSAAKPPPVLVGEMLLHVTRSGSTIREFSLDLARDTASADLTMLARHLFEGKVITSMAYAQEPDSIVWVTLDSGELYSLTYLEEHEVWGWTRHQIAAPTGALGYYDGFVHQVTVVTEGTRDVPYIMFSWGKSGGSDGINYIHRLHDRSFNDITECYFLDTGFQYLGIAATASIDTFTGLMHLRGQDVTVIADGAVTTGVTVSSTGTVDLGGDFYNVAVGYPYEASITTLDADFGDQIQEAGSSIGRYASPSEVAIKVVNTRGISVGSTKSDFFNEIADYEDEETYDIVNDRVPPFIGVPQGEPQSVEVQRLATQTHNVNIEGDWGVDIGIIVKQTYPLPMTITGIAPTWTLGE